MDLTKQVHENANTSTNDDSDIYIYIEQLIFLY